MKKCIRIVFAILFLIVTIQLFVNIEINAAERQYLDQEQLIHSYFDTLSKYSDEYQSCEYRETYLKKHHSVSFFLSEPQKELFDSIFADENLYVQIIEDLKFWFSQQYDEFLYSVKKAKIDNIERIDRNSWKVYLETEHVLYPQSKNLDLPEAISISFKWYSGVNINERDYNNAIREWKATSKNFPKGNSLIFRTVEEHCFDLEENNSSYKIKRITRNVVSYDYYIQ